MNSENLELMKLKEEVKKLNLQIEQMTPRNSLAVLCTKVPYTAIRINEETGEPYFSSSRCDEWNVMREMSKCLFLTNRNLQRNGWGCLTRHPKKVKDMTPEQQAIAAEFLDEVIDLFNEYFVEINREIFIDDEPFIVRVADR